MPFTTLTINCIFGFSRLNVFRFSCNSADGWLLNNCTNGKILEQRVYTSNFVNSINLFSTCLAKIFVAMCLYNKVNFVLNCYYNNVGIFWTKPYKNSFIRHLLCLQKWYNIEIFFSEVIRFSQAEINDRILLNALKFYFKVFF